MHLHQYIYINMSEKRCMQPIVLITLSLLSFGTLLIQIVTASGNPQWVLAVILAPVYLEIYV
jgi:hypothetical protein